MITIHQSICTVIPPHMLRHVAQHGDPQQREDAALALGRNRVPVGAPSLLVRRDEASPRAYRKVRRVFDAGGEELLPNPTTNTGDTTN